MAAKIFRINYKSDFILTMNSEAGWTIPFCIKFWTSIPMRAYYVGFDGTTYTHCAYDPAEPTKLLVQFDDHHLPIGNLHFQIAYHFTVEDFPNNTEDEVFNATAITTEIDGETYQVMLDFTGETAPGIDFNMPSVGVTSVNGKIGAVTLNAEDVGAQPTIEDLATIRSGAAAGATAVQPATLQEGLATKQNVISDLATIRSGAAAGATAVQPATLQEGLATKQNAIDDLATIRSGAAAGATAYQKPGTGIPPTDLASAVQTSLERADEAAVRPYNTQSPDGMGYLVLDKDATFASQVTTANTIYEIRYDYDLNGQTVTIPSGCMLNFNGGSVKDSVGTGKIVLANTFIKCDAPRIGILNCSIDGTYTNPKAYPEWLVSASTDDFASAIQKLIDCSANGVEIRFTAENYKVTPEITITSNISFVSCCGSRIYTDETAYYRAIFRNISSCKNILFDGLVMEQTPTIYTELNGSQVGRLMIGSFYTENIIVRGCKFIFNGTNCISVNGQNCKNTLIENNEFIFKRATNPASYDVSAVYVCDHYHIIRNNRIHGYTNSTSDRVNGGIESHGVCGIVDGNMISNAKVCVNVVNDVNATDTDAVGRMITGNVCSDVNNFLILWPVGTFASLKDVVISNNIATGIKESAICSTYSSTNGEIENLYIHDNVFEGLFNDFDGNEFSSTLDDVFNIIAVKLYTPNNLLGCRIERNVFKNFPCGIVRVGHYNSSADASTIQDVVFANNTLLGCFNGTMSHYYNAYYVFALFSCLRYVNLKIENNAIEIPSTTTMPPILCACGDAGGSIELVGTRFLDVTSKMVFIESGANFVSDILEERTQPSILIDNENQRFIVGDYSWLRNITKVCTKAGRNMSVAMDNASVNLLYGVAFYQCDNIDLLVVDDMFSVTAFGMTTAIPNEKIACICNGKIYTNRWRTLLYFFETGVTQYNPTLTFQRAQFSDPSVNADANGPSSFEKGMMYYSLGGSRPMFKNNAGNWVDVFNHVYAIYHGTYAERPNAASFGHFYVVTNGANRRLLIKNSTGADSWIDTDGFNAKYARKGTTAERPTPANVEQDKGLSYFDTTLNKPIYWTGTSWVDATGAAV